MKFYALLRRYNKIKQPLKCTENYKLRDQQIECYMRSLKLVGDKATRYWEAVLYFFPLVKSIVGHVKINVLVMGYLPRDSKGACRCDTAGFCGTRFKFNTFGPRNEFKATLWSIKLYYNN